MKLSAGGVIAFLLCAALVLAYCYLTGAFG